MHEFFGNKGPRLTLDPTSLLDIGACVVNGVNLAPGRAIPDDGDPRIDHSLEGFLFTCGPDHIRHPEPVEGTTDGRQYPLHGSFSSHPASDVSWRADVQNPAAFATIPVNLANGGTAELSRRWEIDADGEVSLTDRVTNTGNRPFPAFFMYHINIGARLFDADVRLSGKMLEGGGLPWNFGEEPGGVFCVPATGDDGWAELILGPIATIGGLSLRVRFRTDTLPHLQIWRNQNHPAHVMGIEPVSHRWLSRLELAERGETNILAPGESREYALRFAFVKR